MATSADFKFASWSAPEVAWTIEYPLEVMDEIRGYACNELTQFPHGGAEVAGVMFGSVRPGVIRILTWRPIASEYAEGETLRLSHRDRMNLAVQLEVARANPELKDLRPVGWFVTHPNGDVAMNASDLEVHAGFFPESAQVTLVICPTTGGRAEAGFFVREADGTVRSEASYHPFVLKPSQAPLPQALPSQALPSQALPSQALPSQVPVSESPASLVPAPPALPSQAPVSQAPARKAAARKPAAPKAASPPSPPPQAAPPQVRSSLSQAADPPIPSFNIDEPLGPRERWLWAIPIVLALALAGWALYHRQKPAQTTPMAFRVSSNAAGVVQLEWDPNSRAIRAADHGEVDITDDGKASQVPFTGDQLRSGKMTYVPSSGDVGFQLTVYPASGAPVHENTRLIAPATGSTPSAAPAAQPPQLLPGADDNASQRKIRQLTEELAKERAHTGELQNLVRILENRLAIKPAEPQP
jgi:proteasome lid subunit RPN8/RPN11